MSKHSLQTLLENIGEFSLRSYSGRGMYGKKCLGIELEAGVSMGDVFAAVLENVADGSVDHEDAYDLAEAFRQMSMDQMGRGSIVYFPDVPYVGEEDDEEDEDS